MCRDNIHLNIYVYIWAFVVIQQVLMIIEHKTQTVAKQQKRISEMGRGDMIFDRLPLDVQRLRQKVTQTPIQEAIVK